MAMIENNEGTIAAEAVNFAEIPWYRDVRVLRALAQVIFLIGVIIFSVFLVNNLQRNLAESNIPLNFGIYRGPFTVALSEGPDATTDWNWVADDQVIELGASIFYGVMFFALAWGLWTQRESVVELGRTTANVSRGIVRIFNTDPDGKPRIRFLASRAVQPAQPAAIQTETGERKPPRSNDENATQAGLYVLGFILLVVFFIAFPPSRIPEEARQYLTGGTVTRAFITGIANTLRVVFFSLIACTFLGVLVGIGLLSNNVLVRGVAVVFVEIFRNTPLPVQLLFIYRLLTQLLPGRRDTLYSSETFGPVDTEAVYWALRPLEPLRAVFGDLAFAETVPAPQSFYSLNNQAMNVVSLQPTSNFPIFLVLTAIGVAIYLFIRRWRLGVQERTGAPARVLRYGMPLLLVFVAAGWLLAGGWPLSSSGAFYMDYPTQVGRQVLGGAELSIAFVALFLGLTFYTGAFIAEIVRAGIQSVPHGQIEAARSQGFSGGQVLQLVVLPQALRLIIPPLGNQYVNLGKNSSLAILVTYVDIYRVVILANNESGQAVPFFVGLMLLYLALSLTLSVLTNFVNRSTQLSTR